MRDSRADYLRTRIRIHVPRLGQQSGHASLQSNAEIPLGVVQVFP